MKNQQCNYCQEQLNEERKYYCEKCESVMFKECKTCHKPYHNKKFFKTNAERCNSCCKKKKKHNGENVEEYSDSVAIGEPNINHCEASGVEIVTQQEAVSSPFSTAATNPPPCFRETASDSGGEEDKDEGFEEMMSDIDESYQAVAEENAVEELFPDEIVSEKQEQQDTSKVSKPVKRKNMPDKTVPAKKPTSSKKENFTKKEISLLQEVKDSKVTAVKQQKKKQPKDNSALNKNTKKLADILGDKPRRGPKPGKPKTPVSEKEKSQRAFVNAVLQMKKSDPAFHFDMNMSF